MRNPDYDTLMKINDGESKVVFKARSTPKGIREVVMIVRDGSNVVAMNLMGHFDKENLQSLIKIAQDNCNISTKTEKHTASCSIEL